MIVRNVSPEIRAALRAKILEDETNANDVVVGALAAAFKVKFEPTGTTVRDPGDYGTLILRVPVKLRQAIRVRAAQVTNGTAQGVVLSILAESLGVLPGRVSRRPRAAA